MSLVVKQDQFRCSLCVEVLKEPVTLPCGHSYCFGCIEAAWDQEAEEKSLSSCPQCRETFCPRPALRRNHMLAELVEKLRTPDVQQSSVSAAPLYAGPEDVACDLCPGSKRHKAVMSCLGCEVSYCDSHLQPHHNVKAWKNHKLVPATRTATRLNHNMCSSHQKPMEVFCRTDQQCICYLCAMDEHKGHDTVSAAAERSHRQKQLGSSQQNLQQKIQERKKEVKELREVMETLKSSAEAAVEASDQMFSEMKASLDRRHSQDKNMIRQQEETAVSQVEDVLRQLEEDIAQLERTHTELEQLSHTVLFIQSVQSASSSSGPPVSSIDVVSTLKSFTQLREDVSALRDDLDLLLNTPWTHTADVSHPAKPQTTDVSHPAELQTTDVSHPAEPQTREELLQYSCPLSLDPNTMHDNLSLSEENRKVTRESDSKHYSDHPRRFSYYPQVLCREALTQRCYLEVEWNEGEWVYIAVAYEDVDKHERFQSGFGFNSKSWCLRCLGDDCWFTHNSSDIKVTKPTSCTIDVNTKPDTNPPECCTDGWYTYSFTSTRVGVYLDHKAGTLSFYSVRNNTATLLHTVHTTFTQPLYAGIGFHGPSSCTSIKSHGIEYDSLGFGSILGDNSKTVAHTAEVCKIW